MLLFSPLFSPPINQTSPFMDIEATHPSELIQNREWLNLSNQMNENSTYSRQQMCLPQGIALGTTLPVNYYFYQPAACDFVQAKTSVNTESDSRKRSRESVNQLYEAPKFPTSQKNNNLISSFDILPQMEQHQFEIDAIISQHNKKIRLELEERQKQQTRMLMAAIGQSVTKKSKEKDEQIHRMSKLNYILQEKVKSLFTENQLLRDMAQSNEATMNSLRTNLEQVMAHVSSGRESPLSAGPAAVEEDVESCCGSSGEGGDVVHVEAVLAQDKKCRRCGERDACVLLLPCRHLCLCNLCGSRSHQLQSCPVCNYMMSATLHVNMIS